MQSFVLAVVDEYLKRNGFASQELEVPAISAPSPTRARRTKPAKPTQPTITPLSQRFAQSIERSMAPPSLVPQKRSSLETTQASMDVTVSRQRRQAEDATLRRDKRLRTDLLNDILAVSVDPGL